MATAETPTTTTTAQPTDLGDIVRRGIPRELHCKLEDDELLRIARTRTNKEAERDQLLAEMADEVASRKAQIKKIEDEIGKMGRELRTGEQERTVKCNEVFRKHDDGTGWIYVIRLDTYNEVERRPASAHETQRYLPSLDGASSTGLLAQAASAQRSAQPETAPTDAGDDVPADESDDDDDEDSDDGADASKPKRRKKGGK